MKKKIQDFQSANHINQPMIFCNDDIYRILLQKAYIIYGRQAANINKWEAPIIIIQGLVK